jgi:Na+/melibiose symporter-like transporter
MNFMGYFYTDVFGILTFTTFDPGLAGKVAYAYVTCTLLTMVYAAINIPCPALMGVMTSYLSARSCCAADPGGAHAGGLGPLCRCGASAFYDLVRRFKKMVSYALDYLQPALSCGVSLYAAQVPGAHDAARRIRAAF